VNPDPRLVAEEAAELADVTIDEGEAWIAFVNEGGETFPVAGMRYIRVGEKEAEISIAVRDDYQRQGIGTTLLQFTAQQAHAAGIQRLVAMIQYENVALQSILNKIPLPVRRQQDGPDVLIEIDLTPLGE
jgi:GNAT superfamily N-acetyltransferase